MTSRLLVDTSLVVLFAVGTVNRRRIEIFKRTRQYTISDFELLLRVLRKWQALYTVPQVMAEVSNLTDLSGRERQQVRYVLKNAISETTEVDISSGQAVEEPSFWTLGLVDAAIAAAAREHKCAVLTDDLNLYLRLQHDGVMAINFTHLRAQAFGL
jgi:rRNA-processing protein FCF1